MKTLILLFANMLIISLVSCSNLEKNNKVEKIQQEKEIMEVEEVPKEVYDNYKQKELDLLSEYKTHQDFWDNIKYYYEDEYKTKREETMNAYVDLSQRYNELFEDIKNVDDDEESNKLREDIIYKLSKMKSVYCDNLDEGWSIRDINSEVDKLIDIINSK